MVETESKRPIFHSDGEISPIQFARLTLFYLLKKLRRLPVPRGPRLNPCKLAKDNSPKRLIFRETKNLAELANAVAPSKSDLMATQSEQRRSYNPLVLFIICIGAILRVYN